MGPLVTVLLPVYNGALYLRETIDSILHQTYPNFDLLIIDDGSTDSSVDIIVSYTDKRIRLVKNEKNLGLTATFNKGIGLSVGKYVARMDADDIALPMRFEKQVAILETCHQVDMVDTIMEYIDPDGRSLGKYNSDDISFEQIVKALPRYNCLGHSSIMIRLDVYKEYKYNKIAFEDYELWLRMINDGKIFYKISEPLLLYRLHSNSYTDAAKLNNSHRLKAAHTKAFYLRNLPLGKRFTSFNLKVAWHMLRNYMFGYLAYWKYRIFDK